MVRISGGSLKISFRTALHELHPSPLREAASRSPSSVTMQTLVGFDLSTRFKAPLHANKRVLTAAPSVGPRASTLYVLKSS